MGNFKPIDVCIICEQPLDSGAEGDLHSYTEDPCYQCRQEINQGNYIFVLISDKSTATKVHRLHKTWIVEGEEVRKETEEENPFNGEHIVFIREEEAMKLDLLEERMTDPETGIEFVDIEEIEEPTIEDLNEEEKSKE